MDKTLEQLRKNVVDTKAACNAADAAYNAAHDAAYYAAYYAADAADAAADAAWDAWDKARLELNEYLKEQGDVNMESNGGYDRGDLSCR